MVLKESLILRLTYTSVFMSYKVFKELEQILKSLKIELSVEKTVDITNNINCHNQAAKWRHSVSNYAYDTRTTITIPSATTLDVIFGGNDKTKLFAWSCRKKIMLNDKSSYFKEYLVLVAQQDVVN